MKKSITLLALILIVATAFAQKGKVTSAQNYKDTGKLDKAFETIQLTIDPANEKSEKSINWPKTWEVRGDILQAIYSSTDENVKKLCENPLTEALDSYKKAMELDTKNKFAKSIKIKLTLLTNDLSNKAVEAYNDEKYTESLKAFEQVLEINNMDIVKADNPNSVDTAIIFNTGLVAYYAKDYDTAIKYYREAANYGYNGAKPYSLIATSYQDKGDTIKALETLKEGFEKYPDDNVVLTSMIQVYMDMEKTNEAMKYLDMAIIQDPKNLTYYFAKGSLYEKLDDEENAIKTYEKAIEIDDQFFDAYFNLGVLYYNKGVKQIEHAKDVPPNENERYLAEMKKADQWFEKSLPYMEQCLELKPDDRGTIESLKNLYYRMITKDRETFEPKYKEMDAKLN